MNDNQTVSYGSMPPDAIEAFEDLLLSHGVSYDFGRCFMKNLAVYWPRKASATAFADLQVKLADAEFRADNAENTIKNARMQLAAFLKQPVEVYEGMSLGGMINCLVTKIAFPDGELGQYKSRELQEQFNERGPATFVVHETDTCARAIIRVLAAHATETGTRWKEAKYIVEILQAAYNRRWSRGTIIRELTRMANVGDASGIKRALRPGQCAVYRSTLGK